MIAPLQHKDMSSFFRKSQFDSFERDLFLHLRHISFQEIRMTLNEIPLYHSYISYTRFICLCNYYMLMATRLGHDIKCEKSTSPDLLGYLITVLLC